MLEDFLKKYVKEDETGKYIFIDDILKHQFKDDEMSLIYSILKEHNISIREVTYYKENKTSKKQNDFSMLEEYLDEKFITSSLYFRKKKESNETLPVIELERVLGLKLNEENLKHAIEYITKKINIRIHGISPSSDSEIFDENIFYSGKMVK